MADTAKRKIVTPQPTRRRQYAPDNGQLAEIAHTLGAEAATGIPGRIRGTFRYFNCGNEEEVIAPVAEDILLMGQPIACPDAGAGAYLQVLEGLGFTDVVCEDNGASSGDWSGTAVSRKGTRYRWFQQNRYPYYGFKYSVQPVSDG